MTEVVVHSRLEWFQCRRVDITGLCLPTLGTNGHAPIKGPHSCARRARLNRSMIIVSIFVPMAWLEACLGLPSNISNYCLPHCSHTIIDSDVWRILDVLLYICLHNFYLNNCSSSYLYRQLPDGETFSWIYSSCLWQADFFAKKNLPCTRGRLHSPFSITVLNTFPLM